MVAGIRNMLMSAPAREPQKNQLGDCMKRTEVDGGKGTVALGEDGIIHLVWNPHVRIEGTDARAAMAAVNALADGREYPLLVDMTMTASLSRQAQAVFSQRCATRIALLGTSPVDRILANWILSAQKQPCPKRFFNSAAEATKWLLHSYKGDQVGGHSPSTDPSGQA